MFIRKLLAFYALTLFVSSCAKQPSLIRNVVDNQSNLLTVLVQKTDFDEEITWSMEQLEQSYETPSAGNYKLIESSYRGLIGNTGSGQIIIVTHKINRYENSANSNEKVNLLPQEGEHLADIVFPMVGKNMQSQCYFSASSMSCEIVTQYETLVSRLRVQAPQEFLENNRILLIDHLLETIDERITHMD